MLCSPIETAQFKYSQQTVSRFYCAESELYEGRGDFQIIADQIEAAGEGALRQAFEQLKVKLSNEGIFAAEAKRHSKKPKTYCGHIFQIGGRATRCTISLAQTLSDRNSNKFPALFRATKQKQP